MQSIRKQIPVTEQNIDFINNFISTNYNTDFNNKTNEILGVFSILIKSSRREINSIFNFDELFLIVDLLKDSNYIPNINPTVFLSSIIEDIIAFNIPENMNSIDAETFIDKIKKLNSIHSYIILNGAFEFYSKVISLNINSDEEKRKLVRDIFLIK